jgi:hypothetical protein
VRSNFFNAFQINRPKTKLCQSQLTLSNDTRDVECDDLYSKNQENVNINTQSQMLCYDVSKEKICSNYSSIFDPERNTIDSNNIKSNESM